MVNATKKHPIELRDAVCSPAGTTIYVCDRFFKTFFFKVSLSVKSVTMILFFYNTLKTKFS